MIVGQQAILARLTALVDSGRVPHALLFCGPSGCGKLAVATWMAQYLVSRGADERGQRMAQLLQHPDLHFVFPVHKPDGQTSGPTSDQFVAPWRQLLSTTAYFDLATWGATLARGGKAAAKGADAPDSARATAKRLQIYTEESEAILHKLTLVSSQGGYKVMVIWLPELMNVACSNKILKILEEPPAQTVFILVTDQPEALLDTIVSRCQRIDFKALPDDVIAEALEHERGLSPDMARFVAHTAAGSYTRALQQITANNDEVEHFTMFVLLMRKACERNIRELRAWSEQLAGWNRDRQRDFLAYAQRLLRENFIYNFRRPELNFMRQDEAKFGQDFAPFIGEHNVIGIMEELAAAQRDIEQNTNARMVFFDLALKIIVLLLPDKR